MAPVAPQVPTPMPSRVRSCVHNGGSVQQKVYSVSFRMTRLDITFPDADIADLCLCCSFIYHIHNPPSRVPSLLFAVYIFKGFMRQS